MKIFTVNLVLKHRYKFISLFILVVLIIATFSFQGARGIWQPDEGYYVGTAVTMLEKDTMLVPYLGEHEIFLDKPPMIYWGIISGMKIFGENEFGTRFFHGLCFILTAITTGLLAYELFKEKAVASLCVLIYATMALPFVAANFITPDTPLTLWTTISLLFFWKSFKAEKRVYLWQIALCISLGLGFLAKGPAVLIPCGGMFLFLVIKRKALKYFFTPWSIVCLAAFMAVGLSWYFWISIKVPGALKYLFDSQIWGRLVSKEFQRNPGIKGALIYAPVLIFGSLPWAGIWVEKRHLIKDKLLTINGLQSLKHNPKLLFMVCCFFVPLLILCVASSKLGLYAMPLFPLIAIATGQLWKQKIPQIKQVSLGSIITGYKRPAIMLSVWIFMLIMSKLVLAHYPTEDNMKMLWADIAQKSMFHNYEICTVDDRADGLIFYTENTVDHLTSKKKPYPSFTKLTNVADEIDEFKTHDIKGMFLLMSEKDIRLFKNILNNENIQYKTTYLSYERALIIPYL